MTTQGPFPTMPLGTKPAAVKQNSHTDDNGVLTAAQQQAPELPANPVEALLQGLHLPALPGVDQLLSPVNSFISSFGTGTFGAADPTTVLSSSSDLLTGAVSMGKTSNNLLQEIWKGVSYTSAAKSGASATAAGETVATQGADISAITQQAAASVQVGNAKLTAIAESFATTATASAPFLLTPAGQTMLMTAAAESISSALAVVGETQTTLGTHVAKLAGSVSPVSIPTFDASKVNWTTVTSYAYDLFGTASTKALSLASTVARQVTQHVAKPISAPAGVPKPSNAQTVQHGAQVKAAGAGVPARRTTPGDPGLAPPKEQVPVQLGGLTPVAGAAAATTPAGYADHAVPQPMAGIAPPYLAALGHDGLHSRPNLHYPTSTRLVDDERAVMPAVLGLTDTEQSDRDGGDDPDRDA